MNMKLKPNFLPGVFLFLFLVLMASLAIFLSQQPPHALPDSIPAAEFSAERAFQYVEDLVHEPRPVGTASHLQARNYIINELQLLGLNPHTRKREKGDRLLFHPLFPFHHTTQ